MLSRKNYVVWGVKIRMFMEALGVWDVFEPRTLDIVVKINKDKIVLAATYQGKPKDLLLVLAEKQNS